MIDLLLVGNLPHPSPLILYPTRTAYSGQSASDPPYHTFTIPIFLGLCAIALPIWRLDISAIAPVSYSAKY